MHKQVFFKISILLMLILLTSTSWAKSSRVTPPFYCAGTHPSWSLEINDKKFCAYTPGPTKILFHPVKPIPAEGMHLSYMRVYETKLGHSNQPVTIVIKDNPEGCTDGESGQIHGYDVVMSMPGKVFTGCCDMNNHG